MCGAPSTPETRKPQWPVPATGRTRPRSARAPGPRTCDAATKCQSPGACDRPVALQKLLVSLAAIVLPGNEDLTLEIHVDGPRVSARREAGVAVAFQQRSLTVQAAEEFQWPHGPKAVFRRDRWVGLAAQWRSCHVPQSNDDFTLVLEDDMILSPFAL
eukprot:3723676-Prymnesium_polylepis.1